MPLRLSLHIALLSPLLLACACARAAALEYVQQTLETDGQTYQVTLPKGFYLELLTSKLDRPRLLTFAAGGELLIGSHAGRVYRLAPPYKEPQVLARLPDYPHSVALRDGELFIAQTSGLYVAPVRKDENGAISIGRPEPVAALPGGGGHSSRTVAIGPDSRVYVSLGISGNCSDEYLDADYRFRDRRGGILVLDESGDKARLKPFASGLRNPIGFDWHPRTGVLYASNNGPDHLGYAQPPEYFSRVDAGSFHGMPWFQYDGRQVQRDDCIDSAPPRPREEVRIPVATFPARSAPMGVAFVPENALGGQFDNDAIVALRGSWGTQPAGSARGDPATRRPPKLVRVRFVEGEAAGVEDLVTGFQLDNGERWARPVGVAVGTDGALYFTSDSGVNGLFRLSRDKAPQAELNH